jgi:hypothetical protein
MLNWEVVRLSVLVVGPDLMPLLIYDKGSSLNEFRALVAGARSAVKFHWYS